MKGAAMKTTGWLIAIGMTLAFLVSQLTIATKNTTIELLERTCAVYHHKLTGELHPFYSE